MGRRVTRVGYRAVMSLGARLPLRVGYALSRIRGRIRYRRLPRARWLTPDVRDRLGVDVPELESWGRRACELGMSDELELFRFRRLKRGGAERLIRLVGREHLDAALAAGQGALLFSAHIAGFHVLLARLGELGYAPVVVGYSPRAWWAESPQAAARERRNSVLEQEFSCRFSFMEPDNFGVAVTAGRVLRQNGVVVMLVDVPYAKTAVAVSFFGGRTLFSTGPALVAQATGALMLDFHVHRDDEWVPQVGEIGVPFAAEGSIDDVAQACAARLEDAMRRHPPPLARYLAQDLWELAV